MSQHLNTLPESAISLPNGAISLPNSSISNNFSSADKQIADLSKTIRLRQAKLSDAKRILQLEKQLFGDGAWTPGMLHEEFHSAGRWYIVAETMPGNGPAHNLAAEESPSTARNMSPIHLGAKQFEVVGYAGIWVSDDISQVMTIGVDPIARKRGIGTALLQALIAESIKRGAQELFLEVQVDNEPALSLYESFGFEQLAIRKRYYYDKDAYTMRLVLR